MFQDEHSEIPILLSVKEGIGSSNNSVNQLVGKREAKLVKAKGNNFLLKYHLLINLGSYLEVPP